MKWNTWKIHRSNSLPKDMIIWRTVSVHGLNWNSRWFQSSSSFLKKNKNFSRTDSVYKKIYFSQFFKASIACMKKIGKQFGLWSELDKKKFHSWNSLLKILNVFANRFSLWIELIYFEDHSSNSLLKKIKTVEGLIQSINNLEIFQNFWNTHSLFKNFNFFRNWFRLGNHLQCFIVWIACRKKLNF